MSKEDATKALEGFVPHIASFVNTYVQDSSRKTATPSPSPNGNKTVNSAEKWDGTISVINDIEENIWAPRLGMKGKVDVTVEVKINRHKKSVTKVGVTFYCCIKYNMHGWQKLCCVCTEDLYDLKTLKSCLTYSKIHRIFGVTN
jgi:hypothetical protein